LAAENLLSFITPDPIKASAYYKQVTNNPLLEKYLKFIGKTKENLAKDFQAQLLQISAKHQTSTESDIGNEYAMALKELRYGDATIQSFLQGTTYSFRVFGTGKNKKLIREKYNEEKQSNKSTSCCIIS